MSTASVGFENPFIEQRELAAGRAVVELPDRGVISVSGPDRLSWLDSLTSQSLKGLRPGDSAETLQLDPTGRIEFAIRLVDDGETAWLLVDATETAPLLAWLTRMRFMLRVELADRTEEFATVGSFGAPVVAASPNGVPLDWHDPWASVVAGGWQYATGSHPGEQWNYTESLVARPFVADAPTAAPRALEALRIAAWRPRAALEVDERSIPHELDWLRSAVHLAKGCYRGQETVAKVHNLGHPPRRLVMLHLDGSDNVLPEAGAPVLLGESEVGHVTSSAVHHELGPIALAVVKRTADATAELSVAADGIRISAAQELIVPPGAGATADVPRIPRLGAVRR